MKYFCMPADFKNSTIDEYCEINRRYSDSKIVEVFGQLAPDTAFGSCRPHKALPKVDPCKLESYIKYCSARGIEFNYVINATCMSNEDVMKSGYNKIKDFLQMLESIGVAWVTISLPSLMEISKYIAPGLKIKASTVCQINSPHKAKFYEELGIKRIVIDEDVYREFNTLKNIRSVYSGELEVIANSFCVNDCPFKMFHYNSFSHSHINKDECSYFNLKCQQIHTGAENYIKLNWIRPEDIHYYYDIGILYFKIQGRTNVYSGDPAKAVTHYIEERYDGNLISLLELFSTDRPLSIAGCRIDNSKLEGFLEKFAEAPGFCTKVCSECGYCKDFAEKSIDKIDIAFFDIMNMMKGIAQDRFVQEISKP